MTIISNLILPVIVLLIIIYALFKKTNVYDAFITGSKESFKMIINMFPSLLAMIFAINIILKSNFIFVLFETLFPSLKISVDIIPMVLMRPISGSSTLAILNNILQTEGPDSFIGKLASIIQGSTDTTLYVLTLYFGSVGIKKIKYALWVGLFADLVGIIASIVIAGLIF